MTNINNALGYSFYIDNDLLYDVSFYKYFTDYLKPKIIQPIKQKIQNTEEEVRDLSREANKRRFKAQFHMLLDDTANAAIQYSNLENINSSLKEVQEKANALQKHVDHFYPNWSIRNKFKYHIVDKLDSELDCGLIEFKSPTETKINFYVNLNVIYNIYSDQYAKWFVLLGGGAAPAVGPYFNLGGMLIANNSLYPHQINISALYKQFFYHPDINHKITMSIKNSFEIFQGLYFVNNEICENKSEILLLHTDLLHSEFGLEYHLNLYCKFYAGYNATYSVSKNHLVIESFCLECIAHI
jgi:hypothetical protein